MHQMWIALNHSIHNSLLCAEFYVFPRISQMSQKSQESSGPSCFCYYLLSFLSVGKALSTIPALTVTDGNHVAHYTPWHKQQSLRSGLVSVATAHPLFFVGPVLPISCPSPTTHHTTPYHTDQERCFLSAPTLYTTHHQVGTVSFYGSMGMCLLLGYMVSQLPITSVYEAPHACLTCLLI